jgi:hypothetical protein
VGVPQTVVLLFEPNTFPLTFVVSHFMEDIESSTSPGGNEPKQTACDEHRNDVGAAAAELAVKVDTLFATNVERMLITTRRRLGFFRISSSSGRSAAASLH